MSRPSNFQHPLVKEDTLNHMRDPFYELVLTSSRNPSRSLEGALIGRFLTYGILEGLDRYG